MDKNNTWISKMQYAGLRKEEFDIVYPRILEDNKSMLLKLTGIGAAMLGVLAAVSMAVPALAHNRYLYIMFFALILFQHVVARVVSKRSEKLIPLCCYLLLFSVYLYAIILGVVLNRGMVATAFCVLLIGLPFLLTDKPYRMFIFLFIVSTLFCFVDIHLKPKDIASIDVTNVVCFLAMGSFINYNIVSTKISEILSRSYIERERDTDSLTGLLTKEASRREIIRAMIQNDAKGSLLMMDLDNFKSVNDRFGHAYGDMVLRSVGICIKESFRDMDIKGRFGGDEYVVYVKESMDDEHLKSRMDMLMQKIDENMSSSENKIGVTCCIGIAKCPDDADNYTDLFNKADEALYEAKGSGKNRYVFYA